MLFSHKNIDHISSRGRYFKNNLGNNNASLIRPNICVVVQSTCMQLW